MTYRKKPRAEDLAAYLAELERNSRPNPNRAIITRRGLFSPNSHNNNNKDINNIINNAE